MAYGRSKVLAGALSRSSAAYAATRMMSAERRLECVDMRRGAVEGLAPGEPLHANERLELDALRAANASLLRDLAELREREAQFQRLADRDGLTGLYNRRRMREILEAAIAEAVRRGRCVGLLFIDLNGFKGINDEYGHAAGDKILVTVATRIAARVRNSDVACRYGGDEFVVVLPSVPDAGAVTQVADAIRERVSLPCWIEGMEQRLMASIGQAMCPHDGRTPDELLHQADQAMYRLKARMARPIFSLGSVPHHRPLRRRGDNSKSAAGTLAGGDM